MISLKFKSMFSPSIYSSRTEIFSESDEFTGFGLKSNVEIIPMNTAATPAAAKNFFFLNKEITLPRGSVRSTLPEPYLPDYQNSFPGS